MATSGSIDFSQSRNDIITEALELLGVLGEGETPNSDQITSCARTLNMMMKAWQGKGINLFAIDVFYLFLDKTSAKYAFPSASVNACRAQDYIGTTISADEAAGQTLISLTSTTGMLDGDIIGIELDDGTVDWTTISGSPTATEAGITTGLTSAASSGNTVHTFTNRVNRPLKVITAYLSSDGTDTSVEVVSRDEYYTLPDKDSSGEVNQVYYDPQTGTAYLYVWPVSDDATDYLKMVVVRTIEDVDADDDVDYPQEWYMALAYNLAKYLTPKYGTPSPTKREIKVLADELYIDAEYWDTEYPTSVFIQPGRNI